MKWRIIGASMVAAGVSTFFGLLSLGYPAVGGLFLGVLGWGGVDLLLNGNKYWRRRR